MGRALGNNLCNLGLDDLWRAAAATRGVDLGRRPRSTSRTRRSATAASAAWPPASSTRWRRSTCPASATASTTSTACSASRSTTAASRSGPTTGCRHGTPWLIERPGEAVVVPVYGRIEHAEDRERRLQPDVARLEASSSACPTTCRSSATAAAPSTPAALRGARVRRTSTCASSTTATTSTPSSRRSRPRRSRRCSIPSDAVESGRELRLMQEYFLVACAVRDIVRRYRATHTHLRPLPRQGRRSSSTTRIPRWPSPS